MYIRQRHTASSAGSKQASNRAIKSGAAQRGEVRTATAARASWPRGRESSHRSARQQAQGRAGEWTGGEDGERSCRGRGRRTAPLAHMRLPVRTPLRDTRSGIRQFANAATLPQSTRFVGTMLALLAVGIPQGWVHGLYPSGVENRHTHNPHHSIARWLCLHDRC